MQSWLADSQIRTIGIQSLGGAGKSTIASYLYSQNDFTVKFWADVSKNPDFTVFAERLILALGGEVTASKDVTELINQALALLGQKCCLLVVDNLETLLNSELGWNSEAYGEFFRRWKTQGTTSTLLITTQEQPQLFKGLQSWYALGGMEIAEGVELFSKFGITNPEDQIQKFVRYINGHPLTISLVAGFLISDCNGRFSRVEELGLKEFELAYKAEGAHRNKENARLEWIVQQHLDRLSDEQSQFLSNLSVYRLPFTLNAASMQLLAVQPKPGFLGKIFGRSQKPQERTLVEINQALQELCRRSLLNKTVADSFQFAPLVQKFIRQQNPDLTNAHLKAIEYYHRNAKDPKVWQVLDDVKEYLEMVDHCCELQEYTTADQVMDDCYKFLNLRGYYAVLIEIYEKLTQGWKNNLQPEDNQNFAWALTRLGYWYQSIGEVNHCIVYHDRALKIFQQIGDHNGEAASLNNLGNAYYSLGEYQKAIDYYQQSLAIQQQIGDRNGEAKSLNNLGSAYNSLGEYQTTIDYHQQSLVIKQQIGDRNGEAASLNNLGSAYNSLGEYQTTIDYTKQSLAIQQQIGDKRGEANSLMGLGNAYDSLGEYQTALDYYQQSLVIKQQIGDRNGEANSLMGLGNAYDSLGEYQTAIDYYQQSLAITQQIGDRNGEANSLMGLGNAYDSLGEYQTALDYYQQSLAITQQIGDRNGEANSWFNLGNTQKNIEQKSQAKISYERAQNLFHTIGLTHYVERCQQVIQTLDETEEE